MPYRRFVLVHLNRHGDKQECLLFMLRKLYAFVQGRCREDRPDALANHELLLPGHLFGMIVKERLEGWLEKVKGSTGLLGRAGVCGGVEVVTIDCLHSAVHRYRW